VGLGLAIVRSAAEAMGGTVIAENGEPRGLRVLLRLPLAAAIEAARTFPPAR
jgi:signal transduction histidine kinase